MSTCSLELFKALAIVRKIGGLADRSKSISIDMDHLAVSLQLGASVAINGVCLSVTDISGSTVAFDTVRQTLQLSNLGTAQVGDSVNVERSLRVGDEIGGHNLSGHIAGTVEIVDVDEWGSERRLRFGCAEEHMSYLFDKGFVALDGVSLTIADVDRRRAVHLGQLDPGYVTSNRLRWSESRRQSQS